jgi:hypothetical protein
MKIIFKESHPKVKEAVEMAIEILRNDMFYTKINEKNTFDLSTAAPKTIAKLMKYSNLEFKIDLFFPSSFWDILKYRNTLAYTNAQFPDTLFLNLKKLKRSPESIAATIIHECVHALDNHSKEYTFGHGNNSSIGKENTAPYWIGNLAYKLLLNDFEIKLLLFDQLDENMDL